MAEGNFKKITRFKSGPKVLVDRLNEIIDVTNFLIENAIVGSNLIPGAGMAIDKGVGNKSRNFVFNSKPGDSNKNAHPWKLYTRMHPTVPGIKQGRVERESGILLSPEPDDRLAVTGLTTYDEDGKVTEESWFDLISFGYDVGWIEIPVTSFAPVTASIYSYGKANDQFTPTVSAWNEGAYVEAPEPIEEGDLPEQTFLRYMIFFTYPDPITGLPIVVQAADSNLIVENRCIAGRPGILLLPPYAPYYIPI